jgi:hypothetical protein
VNIAKQLEEIQLETARQILANVREAGAIEMETARLKQRAERANAEAAEIQREWYREQAEDYKLKTPKAVEPKGGN